MIRERDSGGFNRSLRNALLSNIMTIDIKLKFPIPKLSKSIDNSSILSASNPRSVGKKSTATIASEEFSSDETKTNDVVSEAILRGLSNFGGADVVESLVYILELEHSVNLRTVTGELDKLRFALNAMFGAAAYVVEEKICSNLAKSLGLDPEGRSLEDLSLEARRRYGSEYRTAGKGDGQEISQ
jgi:hypothetical protein